jgi:cytochrome c oxidase assembly protein Cox11
VGQVQQEVNNDNNKLSQQHMSMFLLAGVCCVVSGGMTARHPLYTQCCQQMPSDNMTKCIRWRNSL